MPKKDYLIPGGFIQHTAKFIPGYKSLKKILWDILNELHVPFESDCCTSANNSKPVRFDSVTSKLQYYDESTKAWVDVPTASLNPA